MKVTIDAAHFPSQISKEILTDPIIQFTYAMFPEYETEFKNMELKTVYELPLHKIQDQKNKFSATINLPFGEISKWELYEDYKTDKRKLASYDNKATQESIKVRILSCLLYTSPSPRDS